MLEEKHDWTYFKRRIYIKNTTIKEIFRMCATPKGLTEWFIQKAEYKDSTGRLRDPNEIIRVGDTFKWTFHIGSVTEGKILSLEENKFLSFTFGENEPNSDDQIIVTFTFQQENSKIWFDVLQDNMTNSNYSRVFNYISCNMGWVFHMNNMKSILENNHDLRITNAKRMHVDAPSARTLEKYQWTSFKVQEYIKASKEEIFQKWISPDEIIKWFLKETKFFTSSSKEKSYNEKIKKGDTYIWKFHSGFELSGEVLDVIDDSLFKFTFGKKEPNSDENVEVTVTFHDDDNNYTRIEIFQENISDNEYGYVKFNLSCISGWSYFLTNLRSIFESGYDLREKNQQLASESRSNSLLK
ncbi:MAG: SRPBCC family protein [Candidatus Hodarchaeales archaeon]|jgi:uncharacterized protein YndB with AHSA1/START domain